MSQQGQGGRFGDTSCTLGAGFLQLPVLASSCSQRARVWPTPSASQHLSMGIPRPHLSNSAQAAEAKGKVSLVLGCPASHRGLVQAPEANIHTYICFRSLHEYTHMHAHTHTHTLHCWWRRQVLVARGSSFATLRAAQSVPAPSRPQARVNRALHAPGELGSTRCTPALQGEDLSVKV